MKKLVKPRPTTFPLTTGRQRNPSVARGSVRRARSPLRDGYNRAFLFVCVFCTRGAAPRSDVRSQPIRLASTKLHSRVSSCVGRTERTRGWRRPNYGAHRASSPTANVARIPSAAGCRPASPDLQRRVRRRGRRKHLFVHARSRRRDPYRGRHGGRRTTPQRRYDSAVPVPQYGLGQELRRARRRTAGRRSESPATHAASVRAGRLCGSAAGSV